MIVNISHIHDKDSYPPEELQILYTSYNKSDSWVNISFDQGSGLPINFLGIQTSNSKYYYGGLVLGFEAEGFSMHPSGTVVTLVQE